MTEVYVPPVATGKAESFIASRRADRRPDWCVDSGGVLSTMDSCELWSAIQRGDLTPDTRVWHEGMECWTPVGQLAGALQQASPVEEATPAPPSSEVRPSHATLLSGPRTSSWERLSRRLLPPPIRRATLSHVWVGLGSAVAASAITAAVLGAFGH